MMNAEIRDRIKARLQSGQDAQTRGCLNRIEPDDVDPSGRPVGMCCLGVVCEEAVAAGVVERVTDVQTGKVGYRPVGGGKTEHAILPIEVAEWMGLDPALIDAARRASSGVSPLVVVNDHTYSLSQLNDSADGWTLARLAPLFDQL